MKGFKGFVPVCVVYVCQHEYFRGPTLSGGDRASPERGQAALQGGDWMGWTERERGGRRKERPGEKKASKISSNVWTWRQFTNRKT